MEDLDLGSIYVLQCSCQPVPGRLFDGLHDLRTSHRSSQGEMTVIAPQSGPINNKIGVL